MAVKQIFFTKKPDGLYAITAGWPGSQLVVKNIKVPAKAAVTLIGCDAKVKARVRGKDLIIEPPALAPDALPCRHAFTFKIAGGELLPEK
jgi:alpha-L-fucosidase